MKPSPLNISFDAVLQRSAAAGGWCYVVWPESAAFFGTRGLVKVEGAMNGLPFKSAFMALGDGRHKLPVKQSLLRLLDKQVGDRISVTLHARLN